jgi:hypothetical protein
VEIEWDPWAGVEHCRDPLDVKVWDLEFSVRAQAALKRLGVVTVRDLVKVSGAELGGSVAEEIVPILALIFAALMPWALVRPQEGADDEQETIELATDNPDTLIGRTSDRFTVHGVRLGMTQEQVMQVLRTQDSLIAERNTQTSFIQVFTKGPGGVRGKDPIFTLNWELGPQSPVITVTDWSTEWLPPNLQRLLKDSNSERPSAFVESFLGPVSSRKTDRKYRRRASSSTSSRTMRLGSSSSAHSRALVRASASS